MRQHVSTLISLCLVGVSLATAAEQEVNVRPIMKSGMTITGQRIDYPRTDTPEMSAVVVDIQPGKESGRHMHPVPTYVHILEGTLTVEMEDGSQHVFHEGQGFLEVVNTWHNGKNGGDRPVKFLVVFAGEEGKPNMVRPDEHSASKH